jgi:hypothetical protein
VEVGNFFAWACASARRLAHHITTVLDLACAAQVAGKPELYSRGSAWFSGFAISGHSCISRGSKIALSCVASFLYANPRSMSAWQVRTLDRVHDLPEDHLPGTLRPLSGCARDWQGYRYLDRIMIHRQREHAYSKEPP